MILTFCNGIWLAAIYIYVEYILAYQTFKCFLVIYLWDHKFIYFILAENIISSLISSPVK